MTRSILIAGLLLFCAILLWLYYSRPHSQSQLTELSSSVPLSDLVIERGGVSVPVFELARVGEDGTVVIAGRSAPFARVSLYHLERRLQTTHASGRGDWIILVENSFISLQQPYSLRLEAVGRDGRERISDQILTIGFLSGWSRPLAVLTQPLKPSRILQSYQVDSETVELVLEVIDYDDSGRAIFSGRGMIGHGVSLDIDGRFVGRAVVDQAERWEIEVSDFRVFRAQLRLVLTDQSGGRVAHLELPFQRPEGSMGGITEGSIAKAGVRIVIEANGWTIIHSSSGKMLYYSLVYQQKERPVKGIGGEDSDTRAVEPN